MYYEMSRPTFWEDGVWSLARVGSLPDALGHATPSKSLPGAWWGILNKRDLALFLSVFFLAVTESTNEFLRMH